MNKIVSFAKSQYVEKAELVFKLCYLCLVFISFNTLCARKDYLTTLSYGVVAFGLALGLLRLIHIKDFLTSKVWLMVLFIVSYILSAINTIQYGYMENVQALVWMCVQYFLIFAYDKSRTEESLKTERNVIFGFVLIYTGVVAVIALIMLATGWQYFEVVEGYNIYGGFVWNRLFGLYMDCNYGAVLAVISILLSIYYFANSKKFVKVLLVTNIIAEYLFLCFSDSRTGLVAGAALGFIYVLIKLYDVDTLSVFFKSKKFWKAFFIAFLVAIVIVVSVVLVGKLGSPLAQELASVRARMAGASVQEQEAAYEEARIGRTADDYADGDISNKRFAIWGSGLDLFKTRPILGVSFRNYMAVARAEIPDTYIAHAGYDSMHDAFVDILASQGILGSAIALVLIALVLIAVWKSYNKYKEYGLLLAIIAAVFVSMVFYSETFYMNTPGAFIFWYVLGYMVNYEDKKCLKKD